LTDTIPAGSITDGVVYDSKNGNVYATNAGSPVIVIKVPADKVIASITVGSYSLGGVFDLTNREVYVFNHGPGSTSVVSGATNTFLTTVPGLPIHSVGVNHCKWENKYSQLRFRWCLYSRYFE
jgi:YVTN family beta-propeller protein